MTMTVRLALLLLLLLPGFASAQSPAQMQAPVQGGAKYVVFVHAGPKLNDPRIKQVAGALFGKGYLVRAPDGDEDTTAGAGVDYFDSAAKDVAAAIAKLMNERLASLGLKGPDDIDLAPRFQRGTKNPPTYIGVWLFGRGAADRAAPTPAPAPTPTPAPRPPT
jgi:hypothetical protein